jgi:hypothetical protein
MKKGFKIALGCLTLLWSVAALVQIPAALASAQNAYGAGKATGTVFAFVVAVTLTAVLFRSALRKPRGGGDSAVPPA